MLFDSTLRKELARSFGVTFVVIITIVLTIMLIQTLGQAAVGSVSPQDVLLLMGYTGLGQLPTMLTLSLFIAIVFTLSRMYRESEMTIWFSSGVSLMRFVPPVLRLAAPVLVAVVALNLVIWPWGNRNSTQLQDRYEKRSDLSRVAPGQFQSSSDGSRVFFIDRDAQDGRIGRNVFILTEQGDSESVTTAHKGQIVFQGDDRFLVLEQGQRNEVNTQSGQKTLASFEQYRALTDKQSVRAVDQLPPKAMGSMDLAGNPVPRNMAELTWRLGMSLAAVNLVLLGIGISATNPRRASNWNLLFALLGFVVYFNLTVLSQTWVATARMSMPRALLSLHGGAMLLALAVIWLRDQGGRPRLVSRRPRSRDASASNHNRICPPTA